METNEETRAESIEISPETEVEAVNEVPADLIPLPPLDGGRIMSSLLPGPLSYQFSRLERFGFPILVLLLFTGVLGTIMLPPLIVYLKFITFIFGIDPQVIQALGVGVGIDPRIMMLLTAR